jgi:hypothetical protein
LVGCSVAGRRLAADGQKGRKPVHQLEELRDLAAQMIQDSTPSGMPGNGP